MPAELPNIVSRDSIRNLLLSMADDEVALGHRVSEWTGHAPILEEDIALSNIAQDEMGHALVWYTLLEQFTGQTPDQMAFERDWKDFRCSRFTYYPIGDFAYTVVRQYLFDEAEVVRLESFQNSSIGFLREAAAKISREEKYHLLHSRGLLERLGDATEESHAKMQAAVDTAFPQALSLFEDIPGEEELVSGRVFPGNAELRERWLVRVVPVIRTATLTVPVQSANGSFRLLCEADNGGRQGSHTEHLEPMVADLQSVYRMVPGGKW